MRPGISGFVITYNRETLVETCLRSIRFVDELIVLDKSSTDSTPEIARRYADSVIVVPWSPTVEATRNVALQQCQHDTIVFLDDDEMFSPAAIEYLRLSQPANAADVLALPRRHYILGQFSKQAYYWPEHQPRWFRRGAISFGPTVHGGILITSDRVVQIPVDSPIHIEHLSHASTADWIERTNRYTSQSNRISTIDDAVAMIDFAHQRIDHWLACGDNGRDGYTAAVALLRAIYDMVDRIKQWEASNEIDGAALFQRRCEELNHAYDELETRLGISTGMRRRSASPIQ